MIAAAFLLPLFALCGLFGGVLSFWPYSYTPKETKRALNVSFGGSLSFWHHVTMLQPLSRDLITPNNTS